jgi:hypothetical protein
MNPWESCLTGEQLANKGGSNERRTGAAVEGDRGPGPGSTEFPDRPAGLWPRVYGEKSAAKLAEGDPDRWDKITDVLGQDYAYGVGGCWGLAEEASEDERREWAEATQRDVYAQCLAAADAIQSVVWPTLSVDPIVQEFTLAEVVALVSAMLKADVVHQEQ